VEVDGGTTFSVILYAIETGTVYETKRWTAAKADPTKNCVI